MEIKMD